MIDKQFIYNLILGKLASMTVDEILDKVSGVKPVSLADIERAAKRLIPGKHPKYKSAIDLLDDISFILKVEGTKTPDLFYQDNVYGWLQKIRQFINKEPYTKTLEDVWKEYVQILELLLKRKAAPAADVRNAALWLGAIFSKNPYRGENMLMATPINVFEEMMKFLPESISKEMRKVPVASTFEPHPKWQEWWNARIDSFISYLKSRGKTLESRAPGGLIKLEEKLPSYEEKILDFTKDKGDKKFPWKSLGVGAAAGLGTLGLGSLIIAKKNKNK